jgi:hypothetical protein
VRSLSVFAVLSAVPGAAAACAVCFGKAGPGTQGLLDGIWWGIILLLSATMSMVGGIGWLLYKVEKSRLAEEARG